MSKNIGRILGVLLSISIIVSGICMIAQCLSIYHSGDNPYTRESVSQAFCEISVPIYICLALIVITFLYNFFVTDIYPQSKTPKNNAYAIKAITKKKNIDIIHNAQINTERKLRKLHAVILTALSIIGFGAFFIYAFNPSNFHQNEINTSMIKAMVYFCVCIAIPFIYSLFCIYINDKSRQRELSAILDIMKDAPAIDHSTKKDNGKVLLIIKFTALLLCAGIILYGLLSGGTADVLTKAINICTECIGLG